jgi:AcrR family transcriptional regulator
MPRAFNEAERARIRERLIAAGKKSINRAGIRLLVVDDIAREAGISKGSFYSFFPSREDFILSVFESWEVEYRSALFAEITEGKGTPRQKLERFFLGAFEILEREPGLAGMRYREIERLMEGLPPERLKAHQASDKRALESAFALWAKEELLDREALAALPGITAALFSVAIHKDDFQEGTFAPTIKVLSEALAMRLASEPKGGRS